MQVVLMVGIQVYLIIVTAFLFEGRLRDKLISIFVFFCILSAAELLVMKCYAIIVHVNVENILQDRMINLICGILVLLLKCVVCYCFFGSVKAKQFCYLNKEKIILCVLLGVMLFAYCLENLSIRHNQIRLFCWMQCGYCFYGMHLVL